MQEKHNFKRKIAVTVYPIILKGKMIPRSRNNNRPIYIINKIKQSGAIAKFLVKSGEVMGGRRFSGIYNQ